MMNSGTDADGFFRPSVDFQCYTGPQRKPVKLGNESFGKFLPVTTVPRVFNSLIAGVAASFMFFSSFPPGFVSVVGVPRHSTGARQTTSSVRVSTPLVGGATAGAAASSRLKALQSVKDDARELIRKLRTGEEVASFSLRSEVARLSEVRDPPNSQTREDRAAAFILLTG